MEGGRPRVEAPARNSGQFGADVPLVEVHTLDRLARKDRRSPRQRADEPARPLRLDGGVGQRCRQRPVEERHAECVGDARRNQISGRTVLGGDRHDRSGARGGNGYRAPSAVVSRKHTAGCRKVSSERRENDTSSRLPELTRSANGTCPLAPQATSTRITAGPFGHARAGDRPQRRGRACKLRPPSELELDMPRAPERRPAPGPQASRPSAISSRAPALRTRQSGPRRDGPAARVRGLRA